MKMKPTPGPWRSKPENDGLNAFRIDAAGQIIADVLFRNTTEFAPPHNEAQANVRLIAEAGTVHHETGLSPRQILEQRDYLVSVLEQCDPGEDWEIPEGAHPGNVACELSVRDLLAIRAAIAATRPKMEGGE